MGHMGCHEMVAIWGWHHTLNVEIEYLILIGVWVNAAINAVFYIKKWKGPKSK